MNREKAEFQGFDIIILVMNSRGDRAGLHSAAGFSVTLFSHRITALWSSSTETVQSVKQNQGFLSSDLLQFKKAYIYFYFNELK